MRTWTLRHTLFNRMKRAASRFRAAKREAVKRRWYAWADRQPWLSDTGAVTPARSR